ncbi:right-handed parallel beta-helix repeat-containing protein [Opitutaceae bacterium TAV4]|nr:right-handed parallel beta-helix repeat-containing protein [Opitutaceae bacterium TAV4]RRK01737.1 right-handed parallel beta-helix repeat-containing protein [Opitutaceae bacterium TAV3]
MFSTLRHAFASALLFFNMPDAVSRTSASATATNVPEFDIASFGAVADGRSDCGPALRDAIAAARQAVASGADSATIKIGAGVWRLMPDKQALQTKAAGKPISCVEISRASRLLIRGEAGKTELIIGDPGVGVFAIEQCENVTLRDLAIDYDPLPFTQGKITAVNRNAGTFDLQIDAAYAPPDAPMFQNLPGSFGMIFDTQTKRLKSGAPDFIRANLALTTRTAAGNTWRLHMGAKEKHKLAFMSAGDSFVQLARNNRAALWLNNTRDCRVENVTVHSSPASALTSVANDALVLNGLRVSIRPNTTRLISTDADGVHCQQNIKGPLIENCEFEGMADDAINIYAPAVIIREITSPNRLRVGGYAGTIRAGDKLQILAPQTGAVKGEALVAQITTVPGTKGLDTLWDITLASPTTGLQAGADHRNADTLYNLSRCGAGFAIRNNRFLHFRGHAVLLRAGNGVVEDNTFFSPSANAITLCNAPDWPEGPVPWKIDIRRNTFIPGTGGENNAPIIISARRLGYQPAEGRPLRNVTIEQNRFVNPRDAAIRIQSAADIVVRDNRIELPASDPRRLRRELLVAQTNTENVRIENLTIADATDATKTPNAENAMHGITVPPPLPPPREP